MDSRVGITGLVGKIALGCALLAISLFIYIEPGISDSNEKQLSGKKKVAFINQQIRAGKLSYKQKDYQKALEAWKAGLDTDPHHKELQKLVILAEEVVNKSEKDKSQPALSAQQKKRFIKQSINDTRKAYRKKEYQTAYQACKAGLELDPHNKELNALYLKVVEVVGDVEEDAEIVTITETEAPLKQEEAVLASEPVASKREATLDQDSKYWSLPSEEYELSLPYSGTPLTIEQCLMIARANSLSVHIAKEEAALARWKVAPARRALYPSFDAYWKQTKGTTTGQDFEGREITIEIQKPLITWGKTKALYLQAKINWEISKHNLQKEITELDFKVEQSFFILADALTELIDLQQLHKETKTDLDRAEKRYKRELSRQLEWLKSQSKVEEIYYRMKSAEKDLILAELTMRQIINSGNEAPFTIRSIMGPYTLRTTLEQCIDLALKNRSDLLVNDLLVEYNKLGRKVARSAYKFNVNLEGSFGMNDEAFISESLDLQQEWFIGLKATKPFGAHTAEINILSQDKVPSVGQTTSTEFTSVTGKIYFWNSTAKIDIKEADIKFFKSIDEYIKKRNSVIFEIKKNYYEFLKAKQQLENNLRKIKVATEELKVSHARLQLNEILDSEIIEAKDRLARSKEEYGQALTGYYTAVSNINKSIGITDYFDVKRGIQNDLSGAAPNTWETYINEGGTLGGPITGLESYEDYIRKLEGKRPRTEWWRTGDIDTSDTKKRKSKSESGWRKQATTKKKVDELYKEGILLYKSNDYQGAKDKFEVALELNSEKSNIRVYLDRTNEKLGLQAEGAAAVPVSNFASTTVSSLTDDGIQAYRNNNYDQAITTLERALEENPNDRRAKVYIQRAKQKKERAATEGK